MDPAQLLGPAVPSGHRTVGTDHHRVGPLRCWTAHRHKRSGGFDFDANPNIDTATNNTLATGGDRVRLGGEELPVKDALATCW